jgi:hypothetical protein
MATRKVPVTLGDGCAVTGEIVYVSGFPEALDDDAPFTRLFALNTANGAKWFHHDWPGHRAVSVCLRPALGARARAVCALSEEGAVEIANTAGRHESAIANSGLEPGPKVLGPLRRLRWIGSSLIACGAGNQVYSLDESWSRLDTGIVHRAQAATSEVVSMLQTANGALNEDQLLKLTSHIGRVAVLDDIGGGPGDEIYACGLDGALWVRNSGAWRSLPTVTDDHLHCLHVASASRILVAGHNGTLLVGNREDGFRGLLGAEHSDHFWSVREFGGSIYLGTTKGLHRYTDGDLELIRLPGEVSPSVINALDSTSDALWVVADRFVARLKGSHWDRFDHPDNL